MQVLPMLTPRVCLPVGFRVQFPIRASKAALHNLMLWGLIMSCLMLLPQQARAQDLDALKPWGSLENPAKDVKWQVVKEKLQLTLPATAHDLSIELGKMDAPRVLNPVAGDFTIQVRVAGISHPRGGSVVGGRPPFCGAGILIMLDKNSYLRLEHAALRLTNGNFEYASWELRDGGRWLRQGNINECPLRGKTSLLKVERRGTDFVGSVSADGKRWFDFPAITTQWGNELSAGVAAVNDTPIPFQPTFSELKVLPESALVSAPSEEASQPATTAPDTPTPEPQ